jgi:hypothetical protein
MCVNLRPVFNSLYLIVMGDFSLSSSIAVSITHLLSLPLMDTYYSDQAYCASHQALFFDNLYS